jgi:hypothetical protein
MGFLERDGDAGSGKDMGTGQGARQEETSLGFEELKVRTDFAPLINFLADHMVKPLDLDSADSVGLHPCIGASCRGRFLELRKHGLGAVPHLLDTGTPRPRSGVALRSPALWTSAIGGEAWRAAAWRNGDEVRDGGAVQSASGGGAAAAPLLAVTRAAAADPLHDPEMASAWYRLNANVTFPENTHRDSDAEGVAWNTNCCLRNAPKRLFCGEFWHEIQRLICSRTRLQFSSHVVRQEHAWHLVRIG